MLWNIVLAWVPLAFALFAYDRRRRETRPPALAVPLVLWLVFLPNAPYLLTDFRLLRTYRDMPIWFDVTMLTAFAWTGLLLGFVSVFLVQEMARSAFGARAGWTCAFSSLGVCGLGIHLGRNLHWNSWDLIVQPLDVLGDVASRLDSPRLIGVSVLLGLFLTLAYGVLYVMLEAALDVRRESI